MNSMTDDKLESNYKGNALLHLLSYMKPYAGWVTLCLVLVLALTGFRGLGHLQDLIYIDQHLLEMRLTTSRRRAITM